MSHGSRFAVHQSQRYLSTARFNLRLLLYIIRQSLPREFRVACVIVSKQEICVDYVEREGLCAERSEL